MIKNAAKVARAAALLLALLPVPAGAAPPRLVIPPEVRPTGQYVDFVPDTDADSVVYVGLDGVDPFPSSRFADRRAFVLDVYGKPPKTYRFAAVASSKTGEQSRADFVVVIPTSPVDPPGPAPNPPPQPPRPQPQPKPPDPAPVVPIPFPGLRVFVLYENRQLAKLPPAQLAALHSGEVRDYLNPRCAKGPDGKTPEWRMWDKDTDVSAETEVWRGVTERSRSKATSLPWLVVSNGAAGYEGPLPADTKALLSLLKKYGGE